MLQKLEGRVTLPSLSRRDFLKGAGLLSVCLALAGGIGWAYDIPPFHEEEVVPHPVPGWLETRNPNRPQLIEPEEGHEEFLRYMCLNDPLLKRVMTRTFNDLFNGEFEEPPRAGDAFIKHMEYAKDALLEEFNQKKEDTEPTISEILHIAFYTFAATYSPYFTLEEVRDNFGVSVDFAPSNDPLWWFEAKRNNSPRILPADRSQCNGTERDVTYRCLGIDRIVHLAQHAFLAHMFVYAKNNSLQDAERMPNVVNFILSMAKDNISQARLLSKLGGFMWELKETFGDRLPDGNGRVVDAGLFEKTIRYDYAANDLGKEMALLLTDRDLSDQELEERIGVISERLNEDDINRYEWREDEELPDIFETILHNEVLYPHLRLLTFLSKFISDDDGRKFV